MDPFLLDAEQLQSLASERIVRRGIAYFKEDRVVDLRWDHERINAAVEGSQPAAYEVEIGRDEDGELWIDCQCPFDWEPACKHAVAVLLAYGARQPIPAAKLEGAADSAVDARMRRGRSEVEVRHVGGDRWMGTWEAWSIGGDAAQRPVWTVELRSVGERLNACSCPDFSTNRLGTCKHIEAVLHHLRKKAPKTFERHRTSRPPISLVHLDWATTPGPKIRLRRSRDGAPAWLDRYFTAGDQLVGELPTAFDTLRQEAEAHDDVVIAAEVERHVERWVEEASRRERVADLAAEIRSGGGVVAGVEATLYPYQVDGVAFLAAAGRAMLADDMGLGKTLQAITAAVAMRRHDGVERTLVICPASLKHQWAREIERFTGLDATVIQGGPPARLALYRRRSAFTLVNYELVLRDRDSIQAELAPDLLILDEAQRIKNWRTKTAAAVKAIETPYAFVLTGTPLENRLEDLYSLMQVVDSRVLGPLWRYLLDFHVTDDRGRVLGYRNLAELRRRLAPVMLRRDKTLVRDQLPDRLYHRLDVELDRRQRELHEEALQNAAQIANRAQSRPLTPREERYLFSCLQSARMACNAAGLVDKETAGSPKLDELTVLLEQACVDGGQKVVVFSEWERMTRMVEARARDLGLGTARLHGGVPTPRRGALVDRFRDDPAVQVFISTDAGGVGLNLQVATLLINLDLPWNPAVLEQRIGRIHRLGQKDVVQIVSLVARDSYEERIAGLLRSKRELFRHAVTDQADADVVGVSKRLIDQAVASLQEQGPAVAPTDAEEIVVDDRAIDSPASDTILEATVDSGDADASVADANDVSLAPLVDRLQGALGARLERLVAVGGALVGVVDTLDASLEEAARLEAEAAGLEVAVELIDARSWAALDRLGAASPLASGRILVDGTHEPDEPARPTEAPLIARGRRQLDAARLLADQGHTGEAVRLAASAMVGAIAGRAGLAAPPADHEVAVWVHGECLTRGHLDATDAAAVSRAQALSGADGLPESLVAEILGDAETLIAAAERSAA